MIETLNLHATQTCIGLICLGLFVFAYILVATEEITHLRKSKPVLVTSGIIWLLVAEYAVHKKGFSKEQIEALIKHNLMEYGELLLFLLVSMTYTNALVERNTFEKIRHSLINWGLSYRQIFVLTGVIAFFLSTVANNLTTAMVMGAVILACAQGNTRFIQLSFINIVVASNAGGVFSPFGDVTTLMVWQAGKIEFSRFLVLFIPALINLLVPMLIMTFFIPGGRPRVETGDIVYLKKGALLITAFFFITIAVSVVCEEYLFIPPFMGMMMGLGFLMLISYWIKIRSMGDKEYDIFVNVKNSEWDTLLFFYGIIFCVGGLAELGYLQLASSAIYGNLNYTWANILIGVISSVIDNIPVMFAVLQMQPPMDLSQWLLVTLTAGVGGSLISIGSAAGVALMGQSKGLYSFLEHLKWFPVIALGYGASIYAHLLLNS
ncbi:MAG TPA: sodium:proton antiporter [Crenotrichaceae bacterium]|nr:sodium:proton antiporter [Crenotrichaceae bacterium]